MNNLLDVIARDTSHSWLKTFVNNELPNPDKILRQIGNRISSYDDLRTDPHLSSIIQSRKSGVLSLEWEILYDDESRENEFIKNIFNNLNINRIISEMLEAPLYGFKYLEIYWRLTNGFYVPVDIIGKPCDWFVFNSNNLGYFVNAKNEKVYCNNNKFLLLQHNATYTNPYGEALLSKCFWAVKFKKDVTKFWLTYIEKYGMPFLYGKTNSTIEKSTEDLLLTLDKARHDGVVVTNSDDDVTFLDLTKASSPMIFKDFIHLWNSELSKVILSQTLTTEQGDVGSYAMSQTHLQVRSDVVESDKKMVEAAFNELIKKIYTINYGTISNIPRFRLYQQEDVDKILAERDGLLATQVGIKFNKNYIQKNYGIAEDEFEISAPASPQFTEGNEEHDHIDDTGMEALLKANEKMLNYAIKLITQSNTIEEARELIENRYSNLDSSEIEELFKTAIMASQAGGVFNADI